MIRTDIVIGNINSVPAEWIFENYLGLPQNLTGQGVMVTSVFNPSERTPSMSISYSRSKGKYMFKDFSTGVFGDGYDLVMAMYSLPDIASAFEKVISEYEAYVRANGMCSARTMEEHNPYRVVSWETREWNTLDRSYWTSYSIGSGTLGKFFVRPLSWFLMSKEENGQTSDILIDHGVIYGYFKGDGSLHKIYQPYNRKKKFINVARHVHGSEQLLFHSKYLVIGSSLKDIMDIDIMGLGVEVVAPDSENTPIPRQVMAMYQSRYRGICTLFDNDKAGVDAMKRYNADYGLPYAHLQAEKDLSDTVRLCGLCKTREMVFPLLKQALKAKL